MNSQHRTIHAFIALMCMNAILRGPDGYIWDGFFATILWVNVLFMARSYVKGPQLTTDQRLEISRKKTAELEKDLGYEPLNLHELDDILLDDHKRRKGNA